jgi:hypothetical protein
VRSHYASANYHRLQGLSWGLAASCFTGTASFVTLLGAAAKLAPVNDALVKLGQLSSSFFVYFVIVLFILAIISATTAFLAHPKQASTHMSSYAGYSHAMRRLEILWLRCANQSLANNDLSGLFNLLEDISQQIKDVAATSIYPLPEAYDVGKNIKKDSLEFSKKWETIFSPEASPTNV